jgi:uncharacterized protein
MNEFLRMCLIACPLVFLSGFVDSIAGGGGVISIPAYMLAGLPVPFALGTNKFAASLGTSLATSKYIRSGKVLFKVALPAAAASVAGSFVGTNLALRIPQETLKFIVLAALPCVAVFLSLNRGFGRETAIAKMHSPGTVSLIACAIGLAIGCYDGMIGPGTGTFLILAFSGILGTDLLISSGCAKVSNLASNLTSMILYVISGKVLYAVALPAAAFCMAGNYLGARYAIKGGSKNVRKITFVVLLLLFVKMAADLIKLT